MAEYIERELVYKAVFAEMMDSDVPEVIDAVSSLDLRIGSIPSADVQPVVRGVWITAKDKGDCCYGCSECGFMRDAYLLDVANFCPNCGAEMRGNNDG